MFKFHGNDSLSRWILTVLTVFLVIEGILAFVFDYPLIPTRYSIVEVDEDGHECTTHRGWWWLNKPRRVKEVK